MGTLPGKSFLWGALSARRCITWTRTEQNMKSENTIKWNVGIVGRTLIEFQIKKFQCFSFRFYLWLCRYSKESIVFFSRSLGSRNSSSLLFNMPCFVYKPMFKQSTHRVKRILYATSRCMDAVVRSHSCSTSSERNHLYNYMWDNTGH